MRKKTAFALLAVVTTAIWLGKVNQKTNTTDVNYLMIASVEALSRNEGATNTGPREEKKCTKAGHKMVCLSVNSAVCTDSDCY